MRLWPGWPANFCVERCFQALTLTPLPLLHPLFATSTFILVHICIWEPVSRPSEVHILSVPHAYSPGALLGVSARPAPTPNKLLAPCTTLRNSGIFLKLQVTQQQHNGEKIGDCSMIGNCKAYICVQKSSQMEQFWASWKCEWESMKLADFLSFFWLPCFITNCKSNLLVMRSEHIWLAGC